MSTSCAITASLITAAAATTTTLVSIVYRVICAKYKLERSKKVEPERVVGNDHTKVLWDLPFETDKHLLHNRPDIVLMNYMEQTGLIIDIVVPRDENIQDKELEKN